MTPQQERIANAKAWPFEEARNLAKRLNFQCPDKGYVLFETGYGPSGLPHIGTFGEVARTTMVRRAFEQLTGFKTRLFAFSDDMDGFRKVPTNIPNQDKLKEFLNKPLTQVPDPFGTHESFAHHNNARLCEFLDSYGFEYEFKSATECYKSGIFDKALLKMFDCYDAIMKIMLPTLGDERQQTYCPFLPISPKTGNVLQVPAVELKHDSKTIIFRDEDGSLFETAVTGGQCKMQWKPDWAMRWYAFDVNYEPAGKDLTDSVTVAAKIVKALGGLPPAGLIYELFLDENGQKISKSKGNGLSIEEWLTYATPESLSLYMFQQPTRAKKLYFDVIPKATDEYLTFVEKYHDLDDDKKIENPAHHIHGGNVPNLKLPVSFNMLLNLVSAADASDEAILWGFITRYAPEASRDNSPFLNKLVQYAVRYYKDFIAPHKKFRQPTETEKLALNELKQVLENLPPETNADDTQTAIFTVGKNHNYENLRDWFGCLYETLLGQEQGPRMGSFCVLYGFDKTINLINNALNRQ